MNFFKLLRMSACRLSSFYVRACWDFFLRPCVMISPHGLIAKTALVVLVTLASYNILWHLPDFIFLDDPLEPHTERRAPGGSTSRHPSAVIIPRDSLHNGGNDHRAGRLRAAQALALDAGSRSCAGGRGLGLEMWADNRRDLKEVLWGYQKAVALVPHQLYFHEALAFALERNAGTGNYDLAIRERAAALEDAPSRAIDLAAV